VARDIEHCSLDAILAVDFRERRYRGTRFRQWAIGRLNESLVKGATMNYEGLKTPPGEGQADGFDEQVERIRDIRRSVRRLCQHAGALAFGHGVPKASAAAPRNEASVWVFSAPKRSTDPGRGAFFALLPAGDVASIQVHYVCYRTDGLWRGHGCSAPVPQPAPCRAPDKRPARRAPARATLTLPMESGHAHDGCNATPGLTGY